MQGLETIARQRGQVSQRCGCLETVELQPRRALKTGERLDPFPSGEIPGPLVPVTNDHSISIVGSTRYVKRNDLAIDSRAFDKLGESKPRTSVRLKPKGCATRRVASRLGSEPVHLGSEFSFGVPHPCGFQGAGFDSFRRQELGAGSTDVTCPPSTHYSPPTTHSLSRLTKLQNPRQLLPPIALPRLTFE
jgi:hypothetical protein